LLMSMKFTDICFITNDVLKLRAFYETVFDVKAEGDEWHSGIRLGEMAIVFDYADMLQSNNAFRYVSAGGANNVVVSFGVDDVDAEYRRLRSMDIKTLNKPTTHPWGARSFQFRDTDGNILNFRSVREFIIERLPTKDAGGLEARVSAVAALAGEIWREFYTPVIGAAQVEYMLDKFQSARQIYTDITQNGFVYLIAKNLDREMIGYCGVVPTEGYLLLSKCYVRIDARRQGVARGFMGEVEALCKAEYGLNKIRLTVNKYNFYAVAAYKKMGFEIVDSVNTDIGNGFYMDDYIMERALD